MTSCALGHPLADAELVCAICGLPPRPEQGLDTVWLTGAASGTPPPPPARRGPTTRTWALLAVVATLLGVVAGGIGYASTRHHASSAGRPTTVLLDGFAITTPQGWTTPSLQPAALASAAQSLLLSDAALSALLSQADSQVASGELAYFGYGAVGPTGYAPNANVVLLHPGTKPLASLIATVTSADTRLGAQDVVATKVTLPMAGPVEQVRYELPAAIAGSSDPVTGLQYYLEHGTQLAILTLNQSDDSSATAAFTILQDSFSLT